MQDYLQKIDKELWHWQQKMQQRPGFFNALSKRLQVKVNSWIPEKIHQAITSTIKQMIRGVLFGARHTTSAPLQTDSLWVREMAVRERIEFYRNTAAVEGGVTGAGGLLLGLADFPILLGLKIKLLFEIASLYGFDVNDYKERVYLLHIFELAFSSHEHRRNVYLKMVDWAEKSRQMPDDIHLFDWRSFQQEYRDYLDIAKMAQLIPVIGAPVGIVVNYRLVRKLGLTAMNAYRMRILK
ncbi:EcsC family protein [Flavihumibacter stibioxidans]|uniref:ABC transporter-associated protein EcsC n=1 Tax=Flavihumibacter stibioxidans TaxID=1834163 RepID=A0ABR7MC88_9BACT|nr:EcsC family protein [Flavihumibacter stibioxidans]MBC6492577.1 ABC transporter-associated protein EcsC [Flavihumibacter stibioxidans]